MPRLYTTFAVVAATLLCGACLRDLAPDDGVFARAPVAAKEPPKGDLLRLLAEDLPPGQRVLRFGITPYNAPREIHAQFQPVANHVSKLLGVPVEIVPSSSYGDLIERVNAGTVDLALLSPLSYVLAARTTPGLQLLARTLTYGAPAYSSFLIVRTRDPARRLEDLKGRKVAWVDPLSTAGFLFPYASFVERGLDPAKDLHLAMFAGTHEAAVQMLAAGKVDAAAVSSGALTQARERRVAAVVTGEIRILHKAGRIPYDALCARPGIPRSGAERIAWAFQGLSSRTREGREVLAGTDGVNGWIPATDSDYDVVRQVLSTVEPRLAASTFQDWLHPPAPAPPTTPTTR